MGELDSYVTVDITLDTIGLSRIGFGVPMFLSYGATFSERSRIYTAPSGGIPDGFVAGTPEGRFLTAVFSQQPHPLYARIGRGLLPPTLSYLLTPVVINSHLYKITVVGPGITTTTVQFQSDSSASAAEIAAGLITALNLVPGKNYTATGTDTIVVAADDPGSWFSLEVPSPYNDMTVAINHADPGVATDLAEIAEDNSDFYGLYTSFNSSGYAIAAANWASANDRIYLADTPATDVINTGVGGGDLVDTIATNTYARVMGNYHPSPAAMFGAAWQGRMLAALPGSATWFGKQLAGVPPVKLTATQRANLVAKHGNSYERKANRNITFNAQTGDGDFVDVQIGIDWIRDEMAKTVAEIIFGTPTKIPYTDRGVATVQGGMEGVLRRAVIRDILDQTIDPPSPIVTVPRVLDVAQADRVARFLPDMLFNGRNKGAIHKVGIRGTLSI